MEAANSNSIDIVFIPLDDSEEDFTRAALLSSVSDGSPEADAIFAKSMGLARKLMLPKGSRLISPSGTNSLSGIDLSDRKIRKGSALLVEDWVLREGGETHKQTKRIVLEIERRGHQALVVADQWRELGVIELVAVRPAPGVEVVIIR